MGQLWNRVTIPAWNAGFCDYAMDQMLLPGALGNGTCFGLSALWLKKAFSGKDFACDGNYEVRSISDMPRAMAAQKAFDEKLLTDPTSWQAIRAALAQLDLKMVQGHAQNTEAGVWASGLYNIIDSGGKKTEGGLGGYLVGLRAGNGAAHAFAIINGGDTWRLFDANYGCFRVPDETAEKSHAFRDFLTDYLSGGRTGYAGGYNAGWLTCRVWPRNWL